MRATRYHAIADQLAAQISDGNFLAGDRLPSIREACQQFAASVTTVQRAYRELEDLGLAEARPQSGYYVCQRPLPVPMNTAVAAATAGQTTAPQAVMVNNTVLDLMDRCQQPGLLNFGLATLPPELAPVGALQRVFTRLTRYHLREVIGGEFSAGHRPLRRQIAQRCLAAGFQATADDIVITDGCQGALALCLNAVAEPGDTIAIESPSYLGLLQIIESLGLKALEIPTDPHNGASLEALELALEQWPIRACALMPACHNPLGASMPTERKRQLVALLTRYQVPLIEDDLFGDLEFAPSRPPAAKAFDEQGLVLYCSSVSKSLGTGLRVGWTIPGRFFSRVRHLSTFRNANGASLEQMAVADFMASGNYERHLRGLRRNFLRQLQLVSDCVHESFPPGTRLSRPQGGFVLWVELPGAADAWQLYHQALQHGIAIMPGSVFSPTGKYRNCFRLSAALPWREETATALATLGRLAHDVDIFTPT